MIIIKLFFYAPVFSSHTFVATQTPLSVFFCGSKQLSSFSRILFCNRCETNFTFQEVLELTPIRFFGIQCERVLAFSFQSRIVAPQVPVTTCNSFFFFSLRFTHTLLQTVVDTRSISDNQRRTVISFSFADSLQGLSLI